MRASCISAPAPAMTAVRSLGMSSGLSWRALASWFISMARPAICSGWRMKVRMAASGVWPRPPARMSTCCSLVMFIATAAAGPMLGWNASSSAPLVGLAR